jgi:hypothetical protein
LNFVVVVVAGPPGVSWVLQDRSIYGSFADFFGVFGLCRIDQFMVVVLMFFFLGGGEGVWYIVENFSSLSLLFVFKKCRWLRFCVLCRIYNNNLVAQDHHASVAENNGLWDVVDVACSHQLGGDHGEGG